MYSRRTSILPSSRLSHPNCSKRKFKTSSKTTPFCKPTPVEPKWWSCCCIRSRNSSAGAHNSRLTPKRRVVYFHRVGATLLVLQSSRRSLRCGGEPFPCSVEQEVGFEEPQQFLGNSSGIAIDAGGALGIGSTIVADLSLLPSPPQPLLFCTSNSSGRRGGMGGRPYFYCCCRDSLGGILLL